MGMKRRDTGILGEKVARDFLKKRGFRILETNYRCPEGEIDIVARQKDSLVFVEVRTRTVGSSAVQKNQLHWLREPR